MLQLKPLRENRGFTQEDLAARLGVSRSAVAMWETGQNIPPTKYLVAIAEALECSVDTLLGKPS